MVKILQCAAGLFLDEAAPEIHHVLRALRQIAVRRQVPHQIARGYGQGGILRSGDLGIGLALGLVADLGVDVAGGAGHVARTHRLATRGLHRVIDVAGQLADRGIAVGHALVMELAAQREGIGRAARQENLVPGHPPADLRQAHAFLVHAGRIDRI